MSGRGTSTLQPVPPIGAARGLSRGSAGPAAAPARTVSAGSGLGPCLAYLIVEFARPMAWLPVVGLIKPGMLAGVWGLAAVISRRSRPIPRPIWYMIGFLAVMLWNIPWAENNRWALWGFQDFLILVVGGVLPLAVLPVDLAAVKRLVSIYFFCHVPTAIYSLSHGGRGLDGWMGDENDLALVLNVAIGVGLYLFFETSSGMKKLVLSLSLGLMLAGVVVSQSRGGFVGLAVLAAFMLVFGPHRRKIALGIVLAAVGLLLLAPPSYWKEIQSIRTAANPGDTGESRQYFWKIGWRMFLEHPITGVGTDNFGIQAPHYMDPHRKGWRVNPWGRVAHSLYFTLLPEQGLVGVALFAMMLGWCFKTQRKLRAAWKRNENDETARTATLLACGITAGIIGVLATGTFLSVLYYPVIWVLVGLLAALAGTREAAEVEPSFAAAK